MVLACVAPGTLKQASLLAHAQMHVGPGNGRRRLVSRDGWWQVVVTSKLPAAVSSVAVQPVFATRLGETWSRSGGGPTS